MAEATPPKKKQGSRFNLYFAVGWSLALVVAWLLGYFHAFENRWEDRLHKHRGMRPGDPRVVIVTIDERSIEEIGQYPWPRSTYKGLIEGLVRSGVKVVGFDVLFLDPSRPEEDKALIAATAKAGNVVHAAQIDTEELSTHLNTYVFQHPIEGLRAVAQRIGLVNLLTLDADGAIRRAPVIIATQRDADDPERILADDERIPLLAVAVLALFEGKSPDDYLKRHGALIRLNVAGERHWQEPHPSGAVVDGAPLMLDKAEYGYARVSAIDVIRDQLTDEQRKRLKGSMALIGSTAVGAFDHYPNPFTGQSPGVEVHANVIDNLLQANYLRPVPAWVDALAILAMTALGAFLVGLSPLVGSLIVAGSAGAWAGIDYALFLRNIRIDFVAPALALVSAYFILLVHRVLAEQKEKRWIKGTFGQYLSPKVVDALVADPEKLRLGGDKRDLSIFFLDIAHFTTISEKMDPEALTHFLNKYLTAFTNIILKNDGVVDKYIGDCVMAFWNAPVDQPRHRELACLSAIECIEAIKRLNRELIGDEMPEQPMIRVGLNAGDAVVGNMGSETRFSYTVIGDTVNLASRLEGANKFFGSDIMASEAIFGPVADKFEARELGRVRVVGKDVPIRVYELWGTKGSLASERLKALELFNEGQALFFARKFEEAAKKLEEFLKLAPEDKTAKLYMSQAIDYSLLPPPDDWDGTFNLTSK